MALTNDDLLRLELKARQHADALRKLVPAEPAATPGIKLAEDALRAEAKTFDQIGDLLLGLQGCWEHHGGAELVRDGFKRMSRAWEKSQTYVIAVEEKAEAAVPDEAAA